MYTGSWVANYCLNIESELSKYLNQKGTQHVDPLKWWAENESQLPNLTSIAKNTLQYRVHQCNPSEFSQRLALLWINCEAVYHPLLWTKLHFWTKTVKLWGRRLNVIEHCSFLEFIYLFFVFAFLFERNVSINLNSSLHYISV